MERLLVGHHIMKTAGTSVSRTIEEVFGSDKVLEYKGKFSGFVSNTTNKLNRNSDFMDFLRLKTRGTPLYPLLLALGNKVLTLKTDRIHVIQPNEIKLEVKAIHGHFNLENTLIKLPKNRSLIISTLIREPLNRSISHYIHMRDSCDKTFDGVPCAQSKVTFEEFVMSEPQINYQAKQVSNVDPKIIIFGVTDNVDAHLKKVLSYFPEINVSNIKTHRINRNPNQVTDLSHLGVKNESSLVEKYKLINKEDYTLFRHASM